MSTLEIFTVPHELDSVSKNLDERIESLAYGNEDIQNATLQAAKFIFDLSLETERVSKPLIDDLLSSLNSLQKPQTRSQVKANGSPPPPPPPKTFQPTPMSSLFIENMDAEQVWMQLDLRAQTVCDLLEFTLEAGNTEEEELSGTEGMEEIGDERLQKMMETVDNGEDVDFGDLIEDFKLDMDVDDDESQAESEDESDDVASPEEEEDILYLQQSDEEDSGSSVNKVRPRLNRASDHGLDNGFFNLDSFNAETERGEAKSSSQGQLGGDDSDASEDNMSVDLFALVEEEEEDEGTTGIFYRDFFEPPKNTRLQLPSRDEAKSGGIGRVRFHDEIRVKKIKPKGKRLPLNLLYGSGLSGDYEDDEDEDPGFDQADSDENLSFEVQSTGKFKGTGRAMDDGGEGVEDEGQGDLESQDSETDDNRAIIERLKDDLFADDNVSTNNDTTSHEKRLLALREQIAQLETENVAKKDWALMGEADSRSRPQNSLLEEDLEFERAMKPIPVISEEVVQGLEQRIKARILENQFDDVVRIRSLEDRPFLPSRIVELQDTKSSQSLAQIYEDDYLASQGGVTDDRDGKLKKEHEEIEQQWEKICSKLDALCNAHFVPKQPKAVISTVSNVPTASTESQLPTAKASSSILAPKEIFDPASSETRSRAELTPTEKRTLRSKEHKAKKKQREVLNKTINKTGISKRISRVKKEKQAALEDIVRPGKGVTVVGKQPKSLSSLKKRQKS